MQCYLNPESGLKKCDNGAVAPFNSHMVLQVRVLAQPRALGQAYLVNSFSCDNVTLGGTLRLPEFCFKGGALKYAHPYWNLKAHRTLLPILVIGLITLLIVGVTCTSQGWETVGRVISPAVRSYEVP